MSQLGTFEALLTEVGKALLPLKFALTSKENFFAFMLKLGWQADEIPQPLSDLNTGLDTLFASLRKITGDGLAFNGSVSVDSETATNISIEDVSALKQAVEQIINGIEDIVSAPDAAIPQILRDDNFKDVFPKQLIKYLIVKYLATHQPNVAFALRALGVIRSRYVAAAGNRPPFVEYAIDYRDIPKVLSDPVLILENAFGWGTDDFDYDAFTSQIDNLLMTIGIDVLVDDMPTHIAAKLEGDVDLPEDPVRRVMRGVIFQRARNSGKLVTDIRLLYLPKTTTQKPGIALMPGFNGLLDFKMQLAPDIAVTFKSDLDIQGGVALLMRPDTPIEPVIGFNNPGAPTQIKGSGLVIVERSAPNDEPSIIFGSQNATRLQYRRISGTGGFKLDQLDAIELFAEFELKGLEFVLNVSDGDGFIKKVFPGQAGLGFDLTLGLSSTRGFYFRGTGSLEISVPVHLQLGPVDVQSLTITAVPTTEDIGVNVGATFKVTLGPLTAIVENMGLASKFTFPDRGGNIGPVNLDLGFKPPNGVGLSVDAGVIKGGGFLSIDRDRGEYAGALELTFSEFLSLKAIGLITTKMPDGSSGFSLLIIITADFGSGFQLGFGFTLLAVGGLLGLNRTLKLQALLDGIRTGAVESILFPQNVVANAPKIISDLRAIFPPQQGTFLIGPMAKIGWGTPTLISISLGIIIEIPGNIVILGVLKVALPADEIPIIVLQANFVGVIEFDRRRIFFFAALFESRIAFLTIEGEMGLLVDFSDLGNFVATVGGFHPSFKPPPLPFPSPKRVSITLLNKPSAKLRIEGYFAVTSNTAQFGARVEAFFGLDDFNVQGHLAFDALFQFSPFFFIFEINASLSVKVFGVGLFSVRIKGTLDGPSPYHIKGHGSISLLFWSIGIDFEETWGESLFTVLPPIAVLPILLGEINKSENWRALLPQSNNLLVSIRKMTAGEADLILHPVGVLQISQRALPLGIKLDKVGSQTPSDVNRLSVVITGGGLTTAEDAFEQFAPAQFQNFSDSDKLSKPAFARERSGLNLSAADGALRSSVMVKRIVRYEEIIIDNNFKRFKKRFRGYFGSLFNFFLARNAVARSEISFATKLQLQPFATKISVQAETYTVAFQSNNTAFAADAVSFHSEASAREYLNGKLAQDASLANELHVIPSFERAA